MTLAAKLKAVYDTKEALKDALQGKEADIDDSTPFRDYAERIDELDVNQAADENLIAIAARTATEATTSQITAIGDYGFYNYRYDGVYLTTVSLPKCKSVGAYAFYYSSSGYNFSKLTTVELPVCTSIGEYAFQSCSALTALDIPACTSIGNYAFNGCSSLTAADLSACCELGEYAFQNCSALTAVTGNHDSVTTDSTASLTSNYAFQNLTKLTSVSLPSLTYLGRYAFSGCTALASVSLPKVVTICGNAFYNCSSLTEFEMPDTLESISESSYYDVFYNCSSLAKVWIPSTVTTIEASSSRKSLFYNASTSLEIFTDVASEDDVPSGWGTYWCYSGSTQCTVHYGATKEEYEQGYMNEDEDEDEEG